MASSRAAIGSSPTAAAPGGSGSAISASLVNHKHERDCVATTNVMQVAGLITSVKTIAERARWARERLGLTQQQVADLAEVAQGTIGNLEAGTRRKPRELLAIARALRVNPGWLEAGKLPIDPPEHGETPPFGRTQEGEQLVTTWKLVPLLPWDRVSEMRQYNDDQRIKELPCVPADPAAGPAAKALQMPDDSMFDRIKKGDLILFDPSVQPSPRSIVLVRTPDGEHLIRMYRSRPGSWDAVPQNEGYATLSSDKDGLALVAVAIGRWQTDF
jgi:transcriptional regulator with XRE-family HTH domain